MVKRLQDQRLPGEPEDDAVFFGETGEAEDAAEAGEAREVGEAGEILEVGEVGEVGGDPPLASGSPASACSMVDTSRSESSPSPDAVG